MKCTKIASPTEGCRDVLRFANKKQTWIHKIEQKEDKKRLEILNVIRNDEVFGPTKIPREFAGTDIHCTALGHQL